MKPGVHLQPVRAMPLGVTTGHHESVSDYTNRSECLAGFHVWDPGPELDTRCLCGRIALQASRRGFIKNR